MDYSDDVEADRRVCVANKREAELSAVIADEKLDDEGARDLVKCAFQSAGILESGTEVMGLMTKKTSHFGGGNVYATVKQRIMDKFKVFNERFVGLREWAYF